MPDACQPLILFHMHMTNCLSPFSPSFLPPSISRRLCQTRRRASSLSQASFSRSFTVSYSSVNNGVHRQDLAIKSASSTSEYEQSRTRKQHVNGVKDGRAERRRRRTFTVQNGSDKRSGVDLHERGTPRHCFVSRPPPAVGAGARDCFFH